MEKDNFNKKNFQNVGPSFEDRSTIVDIKEILDKTKSYKDLLDASKNLDEIDRLSVLLQIVAGMESVILQTLQAISGNLRDFQGTYEFLIEKFLDEEQMKQGYRSFELMGFRIGKDHREEVGDLARRQTVELQSLHNQQWDLLKKAQKQILEISEEIKKSLKSLIANNENKTQEVSTMIREQLRKPKN